MGKETYGGILKIFNNTKYCETYVNVARNIKKKVKGCDR
jgi:hypothetical protein